MIPNVSEREGFCQGWSCACGLPGISDINLLTAVETDTAIDVLRRRSFAKSAWSSRTVPIDCGAFMEGVDLAVQIIHALNIQTGNRILEIGTGSGYTAAVMGQALPKGFHTVDRYATLVHGSCQPGWNVCNCAMSLFAKRMEASG